MALVILALVMLVAGLAVGAIGAFVILFVGAGGPHGVGLSGIALAGGMLWFLACAGTGLALAVVLLRGNRKPAAEEPHPDEAQS
jgi:hypothetical protein